jgi:hypothetical protein
MSLVAIVAEVVATPSPGVTVVDRAVDRIDVRGDDRGILSVVNNFRLDDRSLVPEVTVAAEPRAEAAVIVPMIVPRATIVPRNAVSAVSSVTAVSTLREGVVGRTGRQGQDHHRNSKDRDFAEHGRVSFSLAGLRLRRFVSSFVFLRCSSKRSGRRLVTPFLFFGPNEVGSGPFDRFADWRDDELVDLAWCLFLDLFEHGFDK